MTKRLVLVVLVMAAALVLAAPASAFDGARDGYQLVAQCGTCHDAGSPLPDAPIIVPEWAGSAHSHVGDWTTSTANQYPIRRGPSCAGCHSSNYDPRKQTPRDDGTAITHWDFALSGGDDGFSEPYIGCGACHYYPAATVHRVPYGDLANAEICGQCHNRYSRNLATFQPMASSPSGIIPPALVAGTNTAAQYPVAYDPFTTALADVIQTSSPAAPLGGGWWAGGQSNKAHGEGAVQYAEWVQGGHSNALDGLRALGLPDVVAANCMECHSADYRIMEEAGKVPPKQSEAKYGITCQACHAPHGGVETPATWNEERNAQLIMPQDELCSSCHNGHLAAGNQAFEPGEEVHHPMDEVMNGRGAIGVPRMPSVHKDSCVECHMIPTGYEYNGEPGTSANHRFAIVTPEEAATQTTVTSTGVKTMPNSSCSTCHGRSGDPLATYLERTIDNRQAYIREQIDLIWAELEAAAGRMGYKAAPPKSATEVAHGALADKGEAAWNESELAFMSAFTNVEIVEQEGSFGIHNWAYSNAIVNKAMEQAESIKWSVIDVTITSPLVPTPPPYYGSGALKFGQSTTISGKVVLPDGGDPTTLLGAQVRLWFNPAGAGTYQPIQQTFLGGPTFDQYLFTVMPARNGRYIVEFLGNDTWSPRVSYDNIGLDVAWRVTLSRNALNVRLNKILRLRGGVTPLDFDAGSTVMIQRKKGSGAWKNWLRLPVQTNGTFSRNQKMTRTGTWYYRAVFAADDDHLQGTSNSVKVVVKR